MAKPVYKTDEDKITFNVINKDVVDRLRRDGDIELPRKQLAIPKDQQWNTKQMTSMVLKGLENGDSMRDISKSIFPEIMSKEDLTGKTEKEIKGIIKKNKDSAIRNARTMVTSAENHGRLDSYKSLVKQGVVMKKEWESTPDDRTRPSHVDIDGEEQDVDKTFSNGCMFPGDGHGPAEEVWMCRCAMGGHILGFKRGDGSVSRVNYTRDTTTHESQMEALRNRITKEGVALKSFYNRNVKGLSESDVMDRFIDDDSYVNNPKYKKIFEESLEAGNRRSSVINEINELEDELSKLESVPKPKSEWDAEDLLKSIMGEKPMIQSDESKALEKKIDELWKENKGLTGIISKNNDYIEKIDNKNYIIQAKEWDSSKPQKSNENSFLGFSTNMRIGQYDEDLKNGIGYIAEMTPREYLDRCAYDIFNTTYESTVLGAEASSVLKYAEQMSEGVKFDMGYLNYENKAQEGRHRAMAAELLGIEKIPVYIRGR